MKNIGDKWTTKSGYVLVCLGGEHPFFPGKKIEYEHRIKMAEKLGRRLRKSEIVHHKKAPRSNNRLSNLELKRNQKEHLQEHRKPCAQETRTRISAAKKGKSYPWLRQYGLLNKGRKRSAIFKAKVSASMKKLTKTPEHLAAIGNALRGRPLSKAHIAAIVAGQRRRRIREAGESK